MHVLVLPLASASGSGGVRFGFAIAAAAILLAIGLTALVTHGSSRALFVGEDRRLSTSKTIASVWTIVVTAALFGVVYANLLGHPAALNAMNSSGIIGQYAVLFGGPLGAAILSKQIVTSQIAGGAPKTVADSPSLQDLVADDAGNTDLGDLQYVLFNSVALFFVIATFLHAPLKGLPHIPDVMLGLTSVSAAGYLGKKALVQTGTEAAAVDSDTASGPALTRVRIRVTGLTSTATVLRAWVRFGDSDAGQSVHAAPIESGAATLEVDAPHLGIPANTKVDVSVVTEDGAVLSAGSYTYTVA